MIDYTQISKAIKYILIANVLFIIDINIYIFSFAIDLVPDFIGYLLIVSALKLYSNYDQTAKLVIPFAYVMLTLSIVNVTISIDVFSSTNWIYLFNIISLIFVPISIYLTYQLFTITANFCQPLDEPFSLSVKGYRNFQIVFSVINQVLASSISFFSFLSLNSTFTLVVSVVLIILAVVSVIYLFYVLVRAKRLFEGHEYIQLAEEIIEV